MSTFERVHLSVKQLLHLNLRNLGNLHAFCFVLCFRGNFCDFFGGRSATKPNNRFLSEIHKYIWLRRRGTSSQSERFGVEAKRQAETNDIRDNFPMFPQRGSPTLQESP